MVRAGELMVVIRAQDFASRTIHRVSGELAGMQRMQRMQARSMNEQVRAQKKYLPALRQEAQLYKNLAVAHRNYAQGMMASSAQNYKTTRAGRVLRKEFVQAKAALDAYSASLGHLPANLQGVRKNIGAIDDLASSIRRAELAIKTLDAEKLHRMGAAMSGMGRTMQLFGAIGTAAFALAANSFAKFSASAATAATQMRDLGAPMAQTVARSRQLQEAILEMSQVFPVSAQDMTEAAYDIFSSMNLMHNGVMDVNAGLHLLAVANKAAVAGQVDLQEATNAMIVALNIFDPQLQDVKGTMDEVFNIVRFGKIHVDDLSHVFTQFASAAKSGGLELKDIGAAFATLTLFQDPGKASAGLGRLVELLRVPDFRLGLKALTGIDTIIPSTGKMKPLLELFQEIAKARPDLVASRKAAIDFTLELTKASGLTKKGVQGTVQYRRAFEALITHMETFAQTTRNIRQNTDEMNKAFQARITDPGVQWQLFLNRMKALAIVIGQAVLPVFNKLGRWISNLIQWFRGLNDGTRGTILRFMAWAAIGTLITGVFLSIGGSALQLLATMRLLQIAAAQTGASFITLRGIMMASGIGAIAVLSGAAAAAVMTHWDQVRAYFKAWQEDAGEGFRHFWFEIWKGAQHTGANIINLFGKIMPSKGLGDAIQDWAKGVSRRSLKDITDRSDDFLDNYNKWLKIYKSRRPKTDPMNWLKDFPAQVRKFDAKMLSDEYKKWSDSMNKSGQSVADMAKEHAQAVKQATDNMQQTIKTATGNLINMYEQMQQQNESALGGLFQGPTMSGILGNVFKNINDNLRQFGIQIPVPFKILKQDLEQSLTYFKRWRQGINTLLKRGVPHEMLQQLQALGPEGIPIIEGLLAAPKSQFRGIIKMYKQGQALTDKATKEDMARKLKYWESFGKDAAWATIMGIINNPKNAKIQKMYEDYVKNTYGSILQKTFQEDVAEYMKNAIANAQAQAAQAKIMPFPTNLFTPTPKKGSRGELAAMTPQQLTTVYRQNAQKIAALMNFVGPLSPIQQRQLTNLRRRRQAIMAEYRHDAAPAARRQMARQREQGRAIYTITYQGDTVTIRADGATVASVTRALAKKHFKQKHKSKKGTTVYPGPGR